MRTYEELLSSDPAWPLLAADIERAPRVTVLPRDPAAARACLEGLQVTTRSTLGALAHETGGLLVDHGWLRLLGSGHPRFTRTLGGWNATLGVPLAEMVIVADDAIGGVFAINGGALGPARGNVYYYAPERLAWEDMGIGHSQLVSWAIEGDLATFYGEWRWPGWEREADALEPDRMIFLYPPPWTEQGKDVASVHRGTVPAAELYRVQWDLARQLDGGT